MNYRHEHLLVQAEKSRLTNDPWQAVQFYEAAIEEARKNGFLHEQALASELCASFWLECDNDRIAEAYMRDAHALYDRWGAGAKVKHIEESFPQWFEPVTRSVGPPDISGTAGPTISHAVTSDQLDLGGVIKASQTLSSETDLDSLLTEMLDLVMLNSGAARAVLLLRRGKDWFLEARADVATGERETLLDLPFDPAGEETSSVPETVFDYCRRSRETLVVGDALQDDRFRADKTVQALGIRSILCLPASSHGKVRALLYLENRRLADAFSPEHVDVLEHLSAQFAVSVENALLYSDLTGMVDELQESEERFRNLMEQSPQGIVILTPDGKIIQVNPAWMRAWGMDESETARVMAEYNYLTDPQIEEFGVLPLVEKAFAGDPVVLPPIEYSGGRATEDMGLEDIEARTIWVQTHLFPIKDEHGAVEYVVATNMDVTDLKRAEQEAREQRNVAARMERHTKMGQLTGSIAHEVNQPLTGILSNAQAARIMINCGEWSEDELTAILSDIAADSKRAGAVIRNLRDLYREQKVEFTAVDINAVVDETAHLLHSEFVLDRVVFAAECDASAPEVNGNAVQIQQVLVNLVMNGIEAMSVLEREERRLRVSTAFESNEVRVRVEDRGLGIAADKIDRIFEPLATWKPGGTGMGLAISNSIVEAHGGRMWARNRPGGGAQVGFAIPVLDGGGRP
jgi:signal transduction histidine kinase